jgi:hypothetical protein
MSNFNPRRIRCYTLYREPVWPTRRTTMRVKHKLTVEEDLLRDKSYQPCELHLNQEFYKGMHHKMEVRQGCQRRG